MRAPCEATEAPTALLKTTKQTPADVSRGARQQHQPRASAENSLPIGHREIIIECLCFFYLLIIHLSKEVLRILDALIQTNSAPATGKRAIPPSTLRNTRSMDDLQRPDTVDLIATHVGMGSSPAVYTIIAGFGGSARRGRARGEDVIRDCLRPRASPTGRPVGVFKDHDGRG